jgi:transcriptional regulator with XRE-family HTH domain
MYTGLAMPLETPTLAPMPPTLQQAARHQLTRWISSTGITQRALGERIGRNQVWVSKYLGGDLDADLETLQQIARVFGHTLTQLLDFPTDPEEETLITLYRALRPEARPVAIQVLQEMARGRGPKPRASKRSRS